MNDFRYAIRMLARNRALAAAAIVSLGLGIGANAVIFSWVKAVLLYPLPGVEHQSDLVAIATQTRDGAFVNLSYPDYRDYRDSARTLDGVVVTETTTLSLGAISEAERAERLYGALVSGNYFGVIGVRAALGRTISPDDDRVPGGGPVVLISDGLWRRRFAGDPAVVGRTASINGHPFTIVGVMPPTFQGTMVGIALDVWVPVMMQPQILPGGDRLEARGLRWLEGMARLKPGVSIQSAQAELEAIGGQLARPANVLGLVVRQGMWLLGAGLVIGVTIAYGALPLMSPLLIGISAKDPLTFAAVGALLAGVALAASYLPARRASRVDPIATLRQ